MFNRGQGVTTPQNQGSPANEGTPNTVISAMTGELVLVEYFDGSGRRMRDALIKAGDNYYSAPNSQEWASSLKSVRPWLTAGIAKKLPLANVQVADAVEILPSEG